MSNSAKSIKQLSMPSEVSPRIYRDLSQRLLADIQSGKYQIGARLPSERELANEFDVSRQSIREAIIALEVQDVIEVRIGSGAYVKGVSQKSARADFAISAFELTEARILFEGEAAALAALNIGDEEIEALEIKLQQIAQSNSNLETRESADKDFHLTIARATRNSAIYNIIEELWRIRETSPECASLFTLARNANVAPVFDEHSKILSALRDRNPIDARTSMRAHLTSVLDHLLFSTEEAAIEKVKRNIEINRERYSHLHVNPIDLSKS